MSDAAAGIAVLVALGLVVGAAAVAGAASKKPAEKGGGGGGGGPGQLVWTRSDTLDPGAHVRVSVPASTVQSLSQSVSGITPDKAGLANYLLLPQSRAVLGATQINVWGPGDALPPDWPKDDVEAGGEYHAEFTYLGVSSLALVTFAGILPGVLAWQGKGTGASANPPPKTGGGTQTEHGSGGGSGKTTHPPAAMMQGPALAHPLARAIVAHGAARAPAARSSHPLALAIVRRRAA